MTSLSTVTDDEKKRYVIISYMFECGKYKGKFILFIFLNYSLAAKLRLSIVTTASAAIIYHKCSLYLEKTDFDQYVSLKNLLFN
jgi:hypothetical protein